MVDHAGNVREPEIIIVGAGIIGLRTAIYLELAGYTTSIYAANIPYRDPSQPTLATS